MAKHLCRAPFLLAALLLTPIVVSAQTQSGLGLDVNRYYGEQERALVEGAVEIPFMLLSFAQAGESLKANAKVEVMVEKTGGEEVFHTERDIQPEAANAAMASSDRVSTIETFAIYAPPGEYTARARVTDLSSDKMYEMSTPLVVPSDQPFFSDILLSNHVQKDVRLQEGSYLPYLIGTTMFSPNPRNVFYKDSPLLYFYYEINPEVVSGVGDTIALHMTVVAATGEVIKDLGQRSIKVGEGKNFDLGAFNIAGLPEGPYELEVKCESCPDETKLTSAFEIRPPLQQLAFAPPADSAPADQNLAFYSDLSAAQIDSVVDVMEIWFTSEQRQLLSTLNPQGKVQFLNRFWESLDQDATIGNPATEENEAKALFERRVAYADQFFTSSQRLGHDTDRGRIYLLFGEPTEKIDRPYEATLGPYQIWNYSNQGETFAFGDFRRDGDYRLIYSTNRRFPGDPSIQSQVDDSPGIARESFVPLGRGYEKIIEDIRLNRTSAGFQP